MTRAEPGEAGLGPRVLREVLRTPAFRELISVNAGGLEAEDGRRLVEAVIEESPGLPLDLMARAPAAIEAAAESALALGEQLRAFPEPLLSAYLEGLIAAIDEGRLRELPKVWGPLALKALPELTGQLSRAIGELARGLTEEARRDDAEALARAIRGVDGAQLARTLNALSELVLALDRSQPGLLKGEGAAQIPAMVDAADFGKLRCALGAVSGWATDAALAFLTPALRDPVVIANLVVALPPLINDQLALAQGLLDRMALPDELLASAVFAVLEDLDAAAIGRLMTGLAETIDTLHRGSLVLGATEPAFKAVLADRVEALASELDGEALRRAAVALGEDGETIAQVLADHLRGDPQALPRLATGALEASAPALRGLVDLVREANRLPEESFVALGEALTEGVDDQELAALIRELTAFARRLHEAIPEERRRGRVQTLSRALGEAAKVAGEASGLFDELAPEAVGARINDLLRRLNRAGDPRESYLERLMAAIDLDELELALGRSMSTITGASSTEGLRAKAVVGPVLSAGLRAALKLAPGGGLRRRWRPRRAAAEAEVS